MDEQTDDSSDDSLPLGSGRDSPNVGGVPPETARPLTASTSIPAVKGVECIECKWPDSDLGRWREDLQIALEWGRAFERNHDGFRDPIIHSDSGAIKPDVAELLELTGIWNDPNLRELTVSAPGSECGEPIQDLVRCGFESLNKLEEYERNFEIAENSSWTAFIGLVAPGDKGEYMSRIRRLGRSFDMNSEFLAFTRMHSGGRRSSANLAGKGCFPTLA